MIDLESENILTLAQAAAHPAFVKRLPDGRTKKASRSKLWRLCTAGAKVQGTNRHVRLETLPLPSGIVTSTEAIRRFIAALAGETSTTPPITNRARQRSISSAVAELEAIGL